MSVSRRILPSASSAFLLACPRLAPTAVAPPRPSLRLRLLHVSPGPSSAHGATPVPPENTLAILGGGLSGLSSAVYFLRSLTPEARRRTRVVVLEKEERVGGWCKAVRLKNGQQLEDTAHVAEQDQDRLLVFETGPRSIRPTGLQGWLTIEMAHFLGMTPSLVTVPKTAPSARNRYLYTPPSLTLLPNSPLSALKSLFTVPLLRRVVPSMLLEPFRPRSPAHSQPDGGDESVDAFFARRFGRALADEMVSAMVHGIYAGDARRLSVRAVFPQLWDAEREWGSVVLAGVVGAFARRRGWKRASGYRRRVEQEADEMEAVKARMRASGDEGSALVAAMERASVWGVKSGVQEITARQKEWLEEHGVEVWRGREGRVERVEKVGGAWRVTTRSGDLNATHLITTLPRLLPSSLAPPAIPATTVSVVNLSFPAPPAGAPPLFPPGFGYLIPRIVPLSQNPHRALGVIFDSDVQPAVDDSASQGLVKVSLLLGGSHWLDLHPPPRLSHDELVQAARETLRLHFPQTDFPPPAHAFTHTHRDCIPQVPVGASPAFVAFGERLRATGNVAVVGGGFAPVGVNGCVKAAWEVGTAFAKAVNATTAGESAGEAAKETRDEAKSVVTGTEMWEL
ncbi:hypothetical protein JCM1841_005281 [Sporobolomyces salmonicolor]